jgi:predicted Zn-dependent protease
MQNWSAVLVAGLACVVLVVVAWMWGIPWLAQTVVALVPASVERRLGDSALQTFETTLLKPSALPAAQQAEIRQRFDLAMAKAFPSGQPQQAYQLHFRSSDAAHLGPNAFALPGGHLVLTDELVKLLKDQPDTIVGVLAHEWGHVQHQHGLRMVVQTTLLASLVSVVVGDVSGLIVAVPAVLSEQAYSREVERQADQAAVNIMRRSGISSTAMGVFFERIAQWRSQKQANTGIDLPIALSSHPSDQERVKFFKEAR